MLRRLLLAVLAAVVVGLVAASVPLFLWPDESSPTRADAVVVLSGDPARLRPALGLMERRVAPVLVISDGLQPGWTEANGLCAGEDSRFEVLCFRPDPYSTRGEAERVAELAAERGWRSVVLVTSRYHLTRARMLFGRCFDGAVQAVGVDAPALELPYLVAAEWVKLGLALTLRRGC